MKTKHLFVALMALMMCFVCNEAYAYDIAVKNGDGVTIYYNYFNERRELEVTYKTTDWNSYSGSVVIPEEVTYDGITRKVTSIGEMAFYNCSGLTSVTIPNSVTDIGKSAFDFCMDLTSVTIPNSVTSIGLWAFGHCIGLTSVTIPSSLKSFGESAFSGCIGLTSVTIGNGVTSIGNFAFGGCRSLTSVTIPKSVTSIGDAAFSGSGLTSIAIPNSVTSIGFNAFGRCGGLTSITVDKDNSKYDSRDNCNAIIETTSNTLMFACKSTTIPKSVTSIAAWAFAGYSGLTSVIIPNSVTSIGSSAFADCSDLTSVVSLIENPFDVAGKYSWYPCFDANTFSNGTLYVPAGTIEEYKATGGWKDFEHIVEGVPAAVEEVRAENGQTERYRLDGRRVVKMQRGINIVRDKNGATRKVLRK